MTQILAIALGGATGALLRFLVSSSIYGWLGHSFPYGTLVVNVVGSYFIALMSEALLLEQVALAREFRSGILVGAFGSFTTFSTFSVETLYLFQQQEWQRALANIGISTGSCLVAVLLGLLSGRSLFYYGRGVGLWSRLPIPYALLLTNFSGALLIGFFLGLLVQWTPVSELFRAYLTVVLLGGFVTFSSIYLALFLLEAGIDFPHRGPLLLGVLLGNAGLCIAGLWVGLWGREIL